MKKNRLSGKPLHDTWIVLLIGVTVFGVITSRGLVISFGCIGMIVAFISLVWDKVCLQNLTYYRKLSTKRAFVGEKIDINLSVENKKPLPLPKVFISDELPSGLKLQKSQPLFEINHQIIDNRFFIRKSFSLGWYQKIFWNYSVICTKRGIYNLGPANIEVHEPLGFLQSKTKHHAKDSIVIYPKLIAIEKLESHSNRPLGESIKGMKLLNDYSRPYSVRDYEIGDPVKTIDWKSTAKTTKLKVKTYEPSISDIFIIAVATETTSPHWAAHSPQKLERVVSTAASVAWLAFKRKLQLGILTNDLPLPKNNPLIVSPSKDKHNIDFALKALAGIKAYSVEPLEDRLMKCSRNIPKGCTLSIITSHLSKNLMLTAHHLSSTGYNVIVINTGDEYKDQIPKRINLYQINDFLDSNYSEAI
tara:strand:- start:576 stop:1826 length:1251 start_codon:yes stop_codon:yes gene_type:complete